VKNIAASFIKAKRAFGPALKDKTNPAFRSKYADLGACIDAVEDALLSNGIAFIQETFEDATGVTVETVFIHESGETMRCGKLHVPAAKQDPQGYGSALTYARRYSLCASCGIAPEDDDGNAASKAKKPADVSHSGPAMAFAALSPDWQAWVDAWARDVANTFEQSGPQAAQDLINETAAAEQLDPNVMAALYAKLDSKTRSKLKALKPETEAA
jgi:hypothetical protein